MKLWEERINKVLEKDVPDDYRKYLINLLSHNNLDVILSNVPALQSNTVELFKKKIF
mgnify:CR=1 FL=1